MRKLTALATTALLALGIGQPAAQDTYQAELEELFAEILREEGIPGGVLLVSAPNERYMAAVGVANLETGQPVTPDTRFYAGSTGKMLIAAAILVAVDEGRIALDDPIDRFLASIHGADALDRAGLVTIEHLLNHSSGLPEYLGEDFFIASYDVPETRWTVAEALSYARGKEAIAPGTRFEYTNTNYVILGHILATLDGSLAESLQRWVLRHAQMSATTIGAPPNPGDLFAHGYSPDGQDVSALGWNSVLGDGPIMTTAADLEAFGRALFTQQTIISNATRRVMGTPSELNPGYALGLVIGLDDFGIWAGHAGGYDGFQADLRYYPQSDLLLTYLVNGNQQSDVDILTEAAAWFFSQ